MIISEFGAGLGDVITLIYNSERYNILETLKPDQKAMIVLMCNNPYTKELFLWHPKAKQFDIRDVGFWWPWEDKEKRRQHGLPQAQPLELRRQESVRFYPSPEDYEVLKTLESFPYLVMSASAGGVDRNIPEPICEDISKANSERGQKEFGLRTVVVGRSYSPEKRKERKFIPRSGLIDLIDRLTVPGTIELIARSRGVVCCHSAVCLIAWYLNKPVFLAYPKEVKEREFNKPAHQYTIGKDSPTTMHMEFGEYTRGKFDRFLNIAGKG